MEQASGAVQPMPEAYRADERRVPLDERVPRVLLALFWRESPGQRPADRRGSGSRRPVPACCHRLSRSCSPPGSLLEAVPVISQDSTTKLSIIELIKVVGRERQHSWPGRAHVRLMAQHQAARGEQQQAEVGDHAGAVSRPAAARSPYRLASSTSRPIRSLAARVPAPRFLTTRPLLGRYWKPARTAGRDRPSRSASCTWLSSRESALGKG